MSGHTEIFVVPKSRRVRRYCKDSVGNNLDCVLRWCSTHNEPVWVYDDGGYECPHTQIVEFDTQDHVIETGPWELS